MMTSQLHSQIPSILVKDSKTKSVLAFRVDEIHSVEFDSISIFEAHEKGIDPDSASVVKIHFMKDVLDYENHKCNDPLFLVQGKDLVQLRQRIDALVQSGHLVNLIPAQRRHFFYNTRAVICATLNRDPLSNIAKIITIGDQNGHIEEFHPNLSNEDADVFSSTIEKLFGGVTS